MIVTLHLVFVRWLQVFGFIPYKQYGNKSSSLHHYDLMNMRGIKGGKKILSLYLPIYILIILGSRSVATFNTIDHKETC